MTKKLGIIGYPLGHSLSPLFQQAGLDAIGFDAKYNMWPTPPDQLKNRLTTLRDPNILGVNVTVPHKEAVIPYLDALDSTAEQLQAVNTIVNANGKLTGFNTDMFGFLNALEIDGQFDVQGKSAIIIGAGGSARAITTGLSLKGASSITILNRSLVRSQSLAKEIAEYKAVVTGDELTTDSIKRLSPPDLLVNCTPFGMTGGDLEGAIPPIDSLLSPSTLVTDLVYNPSDTPLLRRAAELGAKTLGGLPMLIYQGAASFKIWTGKDAPIKTMLDTALKGLKQEVF
tara:strand:+ start:7509 stop:8363 length:855 start_codon:yes stop_codon:yes gene_type:complete